MAGASSLVLPGLSVALSLIVFTRLYRVSLLWFVRGRISPAWTRRAAVMGLAASLPLAMAMGFLWSELTLLLSRLLAQGVPQALPPVVIQGFVRYRFWLAALCTLLYLAWTVPQMNANSKLYAIKSRLLRK